VNGNWLYVAMLAALLGVPGPKASCAATETVPPKTSIIEEGDVKLRVSVDKSAARVAEPIRLMLELEAPQGSRVELPKLGERVGGFEVLKSERLNDLPSERGATTRRWIVTAVLETLKTGDFAIPSLPVQYATDPHATSLKSLATNPLQIRIIGVLEDRADPRKFRDIAGTVDVAVPTQDSHALLWVLAAGGGALVAALFAAAIWKRRGGPRPYEWALVEIANLEAISVHSSQQGEAVLSELFRVIRGYFEAEFDETTSSSTSREFLRKATKQAGLNEQCRKRLAWMASLADEVKFARLNVDDQQVREAVKHAKAFLKECDTHQRAMSGRLQDVS
jgi:hypothetical protein